MNSIISVAIAVPLHKTFDYLLPAQYSDNAVVPGHRVQVPFGTRLAVGIIVACPEHSTWPLDKLKTITKLIDADPLFNATEMRFLNWVSSYYHYPIGLVFEAAMPKWLRQAKPLATASTAPATSKGDDSGNSDNTVIPNSEQQVAIEQINQQATFQVFLLYGITGSGKTEVYMQAIQHVIQQNLQCLILIPEIGLTPQLIQRFTARFSAVKLAVYHSKLSDKKRLNAWQDARSGDAKIIIGTRSAVFLPLAAPGLFIIDEEHDLSFKQQQESFRYSARDCLIQRAHLLNKPIVLGTATPALETWHNAQTKRYRHLLLSKRASGQLPAIEIVDISHKKLQGGLSNHTLNIIKQHLANQELVLLFINQRGYAPRSYCQQCSWHATCTHCDAATIFHLYTKQLHCHHCNRFYPQPEHCPNCNSQQLIPVGQGTERIEEVINNKFPAAKLLRIDRDTTSSKRAFADYLQQIHAGQVDILIGTQMLAKGHHFPKLSLTVIINVDSALFSADFRATERMGQLITQAAGRAGRDLRPGKVILQTMHPTDPLLNTVVQNDYTLYANELLKERQITNLPPFSHQIMFRASSKQLELACQQLSQLAAAAEKYKHCQHVECLGPVPSPMTKKKGYYSAQLLLQSTSRSFLHQLTAQLQLQLQNSPLHGRVHCIVDVDPQEI